jgi:hypothetical protein
MATSIFDSFDGTTFDCFIQTPSGDARNGGGKLFIVGNFEFGDRSGATAGDDVFHSAILRNGEWESFYEDEDARIDAELFACIMYKGKLYTGGALNGGVHVLNTDTEKWDIASGGVGVNGGTVFSMVVWNGLLCFSGSFDSVESIYRTSRVAAFDGTNFLDLQSGRYGIDQGQIFGNSGYLTVYNGDLILNGGFQFYYDGVKVGNGQYQARYLGLGGTPGVAWAAFGDEEARGTSNVSHFDGTIWSGQSGEVQNQNSESFATTGQSGIVYGTASIGGELWICGDFTDVAGVACESVAKYNRTDGWRSVGDGTFANLYVNCIYEYENEIYIGGQFDRAYTLGEGDDIQMRHLCKLDAATDTWVPTSLSTSAYSGVSSGRVEFMCEATVNP